MDEDEERCFEITKKLLTKCRDLIVFNTETMNEQQLPLSHKEYSKVSKILGRLNFIKELPISANDALCDQVASKLQIKVDTRIQHKAWRVKMEMISEEYGKADFNYHLFTAALKDHMAEQAKKQQKKLKKEQGDTGLDAEPKVRERGLSPATNCIFYLSSLLLIVAAFLIAVRYLTGSPLSLYNLGAGRFSQPL